MYVGMYMYTHGASCRCTERIKNETGEKYTRNGSSTLLVLRFPRDDIHLQ